MARRAKLIASELAPGDLIRWNDGVGMIVAVVEDPEQPEVFVRMTMTEPWPYILGTYDLFRDDAVYVEVRRDGKRIS